MFCNKRFFLAMRKILARIHPTTPSLYLMATYAHTLDKRPESEWEPLYGFNGHSEKVADIMASFQPMFDAAVVPESDTLLRYIGMAHDMGKASVAFQAHLRGQGAADHKTAAASVAYRAGSPTGLLLSYVFYGHHSGLPKGTGLFSDVLPHYQMPSEVSASTSPDLLSLPAVTWGLDKGATSEKGAAAQAMSLMYAAMMSVRMLHSSLVDADWLATESFCDPQVSRLRSTCQYDSIPELSRKTEAFIDAREAGASGHINHLRARIHQACRDAGAQPPGVYRLNVPTGGGKTLSSLSFALKHAAEHGMKRVIYVIPYTSIIDQTAAEFRAVVGAEQVTEHQSNINPNNESDRNRFATENWDAPLIVTTSVQFFETLFSAQNSRCRKLHNIANSVIIFDEAQNLPTELLSPCIQVMKVLQRQYHCTLLLCTATQPALTYRPKFFEIGWPEEEMHSLLEEELEHELAVSMKRVEVERLGRMSKEELLSHFAQTGVTSALFIVNLTRQAQDLFQALQSAGYEHVYHLSARMCPAHRTDVLKIVRERLREGLPVLLVATRVVEAGVDISFPIVYRDRCGLDSLAQSAGRCNRHGELPMGHVCAYDAAEDEYALPPSFTDLQTGAYAASVVSTRYSEKDCFNPDVIKEYFQLFYSKRKAGTTGWDAPQIGEKVVKRYWDFPDIEHSFNLIPYGQKTLLVPYGEEIDALRERILTAKKDNFPLTRADFRLIQQYSVNIYAQEWDRLVPKQVDILDADSELYMLLPHHYDSRIGLLREPSAELTYIL